MFLVDRSGMYVWLVYTLVNKSPVVTRLSIDTPGGYPILFDI